MHVHRAVPIALDQRRVLGIVGEQTGLLLLGVGLFDDHSLVRNDEASNNSTDIDVPFGEGL